jgi:hypothetical protein
MMDGHPFSRNAKINKLFQPKNDESLIGETLDGIVNSKNLPHDVNAYFPLLVIFE